MGTMAQCERSPKHSAVTYGVFVHFRNRRLSLRRGLPTLDDAVAFMREIRTIRFHNHKDVFIVREPDGATVPEPEAPISAVQPVAGDGHVAGNGDAHASGDGPPCSGAASIPPSMPDPVQTSTRYAKAVAATLKVIGPTPRERVLAMLQALGLSAADAETVLVFALTQEILFDDTETPGLVRMTPADRTLRVPRAVRGGSRRRPRAARGIKSALDVVGEQLFATLAVTLERTTALTEALRALETTRTQTQRLLGR
jgi:hypothetical protein